MSLIEGLYTVHGSFLLYAVLYLGNCFCRLYSFCNNPNKNVCSFYRYRVVVSYPPQSEAELELKEGDVVFVHKKREDGWFKGTLQRNGKTGLFPGSFVENI